MGRQTMSIPKNRPSSVRPGSSHYFDPTPVAPSRPRTVFLHVGELAIELQADRGVFGSRAVDLGTLALLREAPAPPPNGEILDLGSGYGPIANARVAGTANVTACLPDEVPPDIRFAAIYSNPPVRIGKLPLHALLLHWLARLAPGGSAYLVVQRNLGSDSLAAWLASESQEVQRLKSKKGYRVFAVRPAPTAT